MSNAYGYPAAPVRAAFQGQRMAPASPSGVPAWLVAENGQLALLAPGPGPTGFVDVFRVPVQQARVRSAAQRITVIAVIAVS